MRNTRERLEGRQIGISFGMVGVAAVVALLVPGTTALEAGVILSYRKLPTRQRVDCRVTLWPVRR